MDLTPYVAALRDDLAAAAAVGDEATTRAGTSLAAALEPAVRLALMNALSDLAAEVSDALDDRSVSLRLSGREVNVVVDPSGSAPAPSAPATPPAEEPPGRGFFAGPTSSPFAGTPSDGGSSRPGPPPGPGFGGFGGFGEAFGGGRGGPDVGDISRMTLRLVDQIKGQAERAAASQGMSLNSWVAQAVQGALHQHTRPWDSPGRDGRDPGDDGDGPAPRRDVSSPPSSPTPPPTPPTSPPTDSNGQGPEDPGAGSVSGWVRG